MNPKLKKVLMAGVLILPVLLWIGSEFHYARSIRPQGVRTVADHFRRFGEPQRIVEFQREGSTYYEVIGVSMGFPLLVFPSSPPAYVYNGSGQFVDWCSDPGDQPAFRSRWSPVGGRPIDPTTFRHQIGFSHPVLEPATSHSGTND